MTGWRIGFAAGPEPLIEAMSRIQSQTSSNTSSISQAAAAEALTGDQHLIPVWRAVLEKRRDIAVVELAAAPRLRIFRPGGAFYLFIDVSGCIGATTPSGAVLKTDGDVAEYWLEAAHVRLFPATPLAPRLMSACRLHWMIRA